MKGNTGVRALFVVAAAYDAVLGLTFLLAPLAPFSWFSVTPPNHVGYVQFPAALLIIFAIMFGAIARNPVGNRNLILYGAMLKLAFCGVVFRHWLGAGLPDMWKPFAVADLAFLALFVWAYVSLSGKQRQRPEK